VKIPAFLPDHILLALAALLLLALFGRLLRLLLGAAAIALLALSLPDLLHGHLPAWAQEAGAWLVTAIGSLTRH
jgi:hypothetical protein